MRRLTAIATAGGVTLASATVALYLSMRPLPELLAPPGGTGSKRQIVDRTGTPLSYTFASGWNLTDQRPLHTIPESLQHAVIEAEDRRFFEHRGVDWLARLHAGCQNILARRVVRGASTISEQVVRMLHPRPRTLWSRFVEGFEARQLERKFSKQEILEFYLNQVPFAAKRRGVAQAARYYWDRDLDTLNEREQLTLAVMVRAPERLNLYKNSSGVENGVTTLADHLHQIGKLPEEARASLNLQRLTQTPSTIPIRADHFVRYVQSITINTEQARIVTTLDPEVQAIAQKIVDERVADLAKHHVTDAAILIVDNKNAEIVAWVNAGSFSAERGSQIDAVLTPRQPGSTLKPLLYAAALSKGWTGATIISDSPLSEAVGAGLHTYRNYSRTYYGDISLREALGNSLNIPAIKTVLFVGVYEFLQILRSAGFTSLQKGAEFYGEGLALGNGEVTLFELVQAYTMLANRGIWRPLHATRGDDTRSNEKPRRILSPEVSSIIGNILSDPQARRREFGNDGLLRLPVQTAVKTGTSTDYRDAWTIGYTENFTVGVWMGNLNRTSMQDITGAKGPALVLRSIFSKLQNLQESRPLYLSPSVVKYTICPHSGKRAGPNCPHIEELFIPGTEPTSTCSRKHDDLEPTSKENPHDTDPVEITMPTPGLNFARDPRIPDAFEAIPFELSAQRPIMKVRWIVDDKEFGTTSGNIRKLLWPLVEGHHVVKAEVTFVHSNERTTTQEVGFWVR
jgi:penicillin-binding protein 1C